MTSLVTDAPELRREASRLRLALSNAGLAMLLAVGYIDPGNWWRPVALDIALVGFSSVKIPTLARRAVAVIPASIAIACGVGEITVPAVTGVLALVPM